MQIKTKINEDISMIKKQWLFALLIGICFAGSSIEAGLLSWITNPVNSYNIMKEKDLMRKYLTITGDDNTKKGKENIQKKWLYLREK
jgi:uncharacterized protein (DUF2062 family)